MVLDKIEKENSDNVRFILNQKTERAYTNISKQ